MSRLEAAMWLPVCECAYGRLCGSCARSVAQYRGAGLAGPLLVRELLVCALDRSLGTHELAPPPCIPRGEAHPLRLALAACARPRDLSRVRVRDGVRVAPLSLSVLMAALLPVLSGCRWLVCLRVGTTIRPTTARISEIHSLLTREGTITGAAQPRRASAEGWRHCIGHLTGKSVSSTPKGLEKRAATCK
jgi:hypothetical protein